MQSSTTPPALDFRRGESVRQGVLRLTRGLADAARSQSIRPAREYDSAVHVSRLILKRARALVRLLRPSLGTAQARLLRSRLAVAARRLSPSRDALVARRTLESLAKELPGSRRASLEALLQRFPARTRDPRTASVVVGKALKLSAGSVEQLARSLPRLDWKHRGWSLLRAGLEDSYRRARRRFRAAHTDSSDAAFHDWRKAVKTLQYHLLLVRGAAPKRLGAQVRRLDNLGTLLGWEHDLSVLAAMLRLSEAELGGRTVVAPVLRAAANRQQALRKRALRLGRHCFSQAVRDYVSAIHGFWKAWRKP